MSFFLQFVLKFGVFIILQYSILLNVTICDTNSYLFNSEAILHGEEEVHQWLEYGEVPWKKVDNLYMTVIFIFQHWMCCYNQQNIMLLNHLPNLAGLNNLTCHFFFSNLINKNWIYKLYLPVIII